MNKKFLLLIIIIGCLGCSSKSIIGKYTNVSNSEVAFSGKAITFNEDSTFTLNEWTDSYSISKDENGKIQCNNKKGKGRGTYQLSKKSITLTFTNNDFLTCHLDIKEAEDFKTIDVELVDEISAPYKGSMILIETDDKEVVATGMTDENGIYSFKIKNELKPKFIIINNFLAEEKRIAIEAYKGKSSHEIKTCMGYYGNQDVEKIWYRLRKKYFYYKKEEAKVVKLKRIK